MYNSQNVTRLGFIYINIYIYINSLGELHIVSYVLLVFRNLRKTTFLA